MNKGFLSQFQDRTFFDALRFKRQRDLDVRKLNHSWESQGHKIYPSSIKSLTMCPTRFVQVDVHQPASFPIETVYSLEMGKQVHTMLQNEGLHIPGLYFDPPDYSQYGKLCKALNEKYIQLAPEVTVLDPDSGISGRADMVLKLNDDPVVLDIKTTAYEDAKFNVKLDAWETDRWNRKCEKEYPQDEHVLQVNIYCYLMNKWKLYPQRVSRAGLAYLNLLIKPGNPLAEFETYWDFTQETEDKVALLIEHLGLARRAYIDGIERPCEYQACRAHHLKRKLKGEIVDALE